MAIYDRLQDVLCTKCGNPLLSHRFDPNVSVQACQAGCSHYFLETCKDCQKKFEEEKATRLAQVQSQSTEATEAVVSISPPTEPATVVP